MDENGHALDGTFTDSEAALETMRRYELFLQLQAEADDLTDGEYMARLDEISGGDWSDLIQGAEAYGEDEEETAAMAAARREAEEMPPGQTIEGIDTAGGPTVLPGQQPQAQDDMSYNGTNGVPEIETETEAGIENSEHGAVPGYDDAIPESEFYGEAQETVTMPDGTVPEPGETDDLDIDSESDQAADAAEQEQSVGDNAYDAFQDGAALSGTADGRTPDDPEEEPEPEPGFETAAASTPSPEDGAIPAGLLPDDDEDIPEGRFVEHSEFHAHDVLDDIAVGSGLAGAVVSYEYVPPEPAKTELPVPEPGKTPALAAVYREIERMDGPGRDEPSMDGPSGP